MDEVRSLATTLKNDPSERVRNAAGQILGPLLVSEQANPRSGR